MVDAAARLSTGTLQLEYGGRPCAEIARANGAESCGRRQCDGSDRLIKIDVPERAPAVRCAPHISEYLLAAVGPMTSGELPSELWRARAGKRVAHLVGDCPSLSEEASGRWVSTEYLRRADYRLCRVCGDGRRL